MGVAVEKAESFLSKVSERDTEGHIVGILGLSQKIHPHRFEVNGRKLSTWCAWDSLFLPAMLKQAAKVESSCPVTKRTIRLTVTPDKVEAWEPASAAVSLVVPRPVIKGWESVEEVWTTFCCLVHFFSTPEAARDWFSGREQDAIVLGVEEAHELGRLAFEELLKYA
jgi:alkylmercury lyase